MGIGDSNAGEFRAVLRQDGKTEIFCTDDEGEFLRFNLEQLLLGYGVEAKVNVDPLKDRWFRVEIAYAVGTEQDALWDILDDLDAVFRGKGWYEQRDEGQNEDGTVIWCVVRHDNACPWM